MSDKSIEPSVKDEPLDGYVWETFFSPWKNVAIREGEDFIRVVIEGPGYDIETRISFERLREFLSDNEVRYMD